jgi:voltage-gated potassium channel
MVGAVGDDGRPTAQQRWERYTQRPLFVLAVAFAVAYTVPIVAPHFGHGVVWTCWATEWAVWAAFALDYGVRLVVAPHRWAFVRSHKIDLIAVLLPMVQPLRLLRLVSTLLLVGQRARMASQVRLTTYVIGAVVGLTMFGSLAVLSVERNAPNGNIKTLSDALWWSFATMTTVGYGDLAPVTGLGRLLAVGLMLSGIALLGVVTANIAAWFIARFDADDAAEAKQTAAIEALTAEVRALRAEVTEARAEVTGVRAEVTETRAEVTEVRTEVARARTEATEAGTGVKVTETAGWNGEVNEGGCGVRRTT